MKVGDEIAKLILYYEAQKVYFDMGDMKHYEEEQRKKEEQIGKLNEIVVIEQGR